MDSVIINNMHIAESIEIVGFFIQVGRITVEIG